MDTITYLEDKIGKEQLQQLISKNFDENQTTQIKQIIKNSNLEYWQEIVEFNFEHQEQELSEIIFKKIICYFNTKNNNKELIILINNLISLEIKSLSENILTFDSMLSLSIDILYLKRLKIKEAWELLKKTCLVQISIASEVYKKIKHNYDEDEDEVKNNFEFYDDLYPSGYIYTEFEVTYHAGYLHYVKLLIAEGNYSKALSFYDEARSLGWHISMNSNTLERLKLKKDEQLQPNDNIQEEETKALIVTIVPDLRERGIDRKKQLSDSELKIYEEMISDMNNDGYKVDLDYADFLSVYLLELLWGNGKNNDTKNLISKLENVIKKSEDESFPIRYFIYAKLDCYLINEEYETFLFETERSKISKLTYKNILPIRTSVILKISKIKKFDDIRDYIISPNSVFFKRNKKLYYEVLKNRIENDSELLEEINDYLRKKLKLNYKYNGFNFRWNNANKLYKSHLKIPSESNSTLKNGISTITKKLTNEIISEIKNIEKIN